jgi:acyl carrier protein
MTVFTSIRVLLERRSVEHVDLQRHSDLYADLALDSLEVAELSATLEDRLGHDPYSIGLVPRTVSEVIEYYQP